MKHAEMWLVAFGALVLMFSVSLGRMSQHPAASPAPVDAGASQDAAAADVGAQSSYTSDDSVQAVPNVSGAGCGDLWAYIDGGIEKYEPHGMCKPCLLGCANIVQSEARDPAKADPYTSALQEYDACARRCRSQHADFFWGQEL